MNEQSSYTASLLWFWVHVSCFCNSCYGETSSTQCLMELLILTGWKETKYASRWLRLIRTILLYSDALSMSIVVIQTPFSLDSMEQEWGAICCMEGRPDRISVDRCYHDSGFLKWISTREPHLAIFFFLFYLSVPSFVSLFPAKEVGLDASPCTPFGCLFLDTWWYGMFCDL